MGLNLFQKHATSKVTNIINTLIENSKGDDDVLMEVSLPYLLQAIQEQQDIGEPGPTEAARAIRKKLKYGTMREELNAIRLLELLVANGGGGDMTLLYNDRKLTRYLIFIASGVLDQMQVNPVIRRRVINLLKDFQTYYSEDDARQTLAGLYDQCGFTRGGRKFVKDRRTSSTVPDFMSDQPDGSIFSDAAAYETPASKTNDELDEKYRIPTIDIAAAKPKIDQTVANAGKQAANLQSTLAALGPDELSIHSAQANQEFDQCRDVRRQILRYLQLVHSEDLITPLLKANDELVTALEHYANLAVPQGKKDEVASQADHDSLLYYEDVDSLNEDAGKDAWASTGDAEGYSEDTESITAKAHKSKAAAATTTAAAADAANPFSDAAK